MGYLLTKNVSYEETCASQFFMETCYIEIYNNYKKKEIYIFPKIYLAITGLWLDWRQTNPHMFGNILATYIKILL